jgi:isochorismate hydrolase
MQTIKFLAIFIKYDPWKEKNQSLENWIENVMKLKRRFKRAKIKLKKEKDQRKCFKTKWNGSPEFELLFKQ